jgi:protein gp37
MTKIEWTHRPGTIGESWNIVGGCAKVSPGCDNCYALSMSWRIQNMKKRPDRYEGVVTTSRVDGPFVVLGVPKWTGRINLDADELERPYRWRKPRMVFVQSMGDLFHPKVPDKFIAKTFAVMSMCPEHTFLVLTKRAERMKEWFDGADPSVPTTVWWKGDVMSYPVNWPVDNIWLGVTAENQEQADLRVPLLLETPAAVRWVSVEPMLGAIQMSYLSDGGLNRIDALRGVIWQPGYTLQLQVEKVDWIVIGAESGPNARVMRNRWALDLISQCDGAGVPVFVKQVQLGSERWVSKDPDDVRTERCGADNESECWEISCWLPELRRREWPR